MTPAEATLAKARRYNRMVKDDPPRETHSSEHAFNPWEGDSETFGRNCKALGFSIFQALSFFGDADSTGPLSDFLEGYHGKPCVHFVGFRGEEYWSAVRIWGTPDYVWPAASFRILGECAAHDTVIFGPSAFNRPKKWKLFAH